MAQENRSAEDSVHESLFKNELDTCSDLINNCREIIYSNLLPDMDPQMDIKRLTRIWRIQNGSIKVLPGNLTFFCSELQYYLNTKRDPDVYSSALNVLSTIIYIYMSDVERGSLQRYLKNPGAELPKELRRFSSSTLNTFIDFYGTARMDSVLSALLTTLKTLDPNRADKKQ
ncbi:hypothetical protein RF11_15553 [Thelohanellus kitauei]|uniref:Uncharacterized protein n=1 Tax=Thelohanellus kitauei TaxID=669202 RepID=A0A0C2JJ01_THEKT|nr:hypothetical protein RF11_15553 [Thelohanellus kitauei]